METAKYTENELKVIKEFSMNYDTEDSNLSDNANYLDISEVKAILSWNAKQATGLMVSLFNKGLLEADEVNGDPIYMISAFGVKEHFRLK
jgi:hypothetical protein